MAKSKGTIDGAVLNRIELAVGLFIDKNGQVPTNWAELDGIYDFTPSNLALSMASRKTRVLQQEYAVLPNPLKLPGGREIVVIQRLPSKSDSGALLRRYVGLSDGKVGSSTTREDSLPAQIREAAFPEPDPMVVTRALEKLAPKLAEAEQTRRLDKIELLFLLSVFGIPLTFLCLPFILAIRRRSRGNQ